MAFIGISVPPEVSRLLSSIEVEGEKEDLSQLHVTVVYIGSEVPMETILKATEAMYDVLGKVDPFSCSLTSVEHFEPSEHSDGKYPVICPIISPALHQLRAALTKALDKVEVKYPNSFPEYKPHVTLAYSDKEPKPQTFKTLSWEVYEVVLWGGDSGEDRVHVSVPLRHGSLAAKVAHRYLTEP